MKFTVAICTWNGAKRMKKTLESFTELRSTETINWEIVVVDNNSTDNIDQVCKTFSDQLPIRLVSETRQGHSWSRNCAIDNATGEFIAWTDDDVIVDRDWLLVYDRAVADDPDADFWGGKIIPSFEHSIPKWVKANWEICSGVFAERDLGDERFEILTAEQLPYGANFMTRTSVQRRFRFDPQFGRVATGVRGFDEIDVLSRMLAAGHTGIWVPDSKLQHLIPESRTTLKYVADFYEGQGETWIQRGVSNRTVNELQADIRRKQTQYRTARILFSRRWFPIFTELSNLRGQLREASRR